MKPLPWSHSALSDFLNCPKAYYHKRVLKDVVDPPNDAGLAGDFIHKAFEAYLKNGTSLPSHYPDDIREWPSGIKPPSAYQAYLDRLRQGSGTMYVECRYAINRKFEPVDFFAPDVWCRGILDVLNINGAKARILDHKTGKRKYDTRQLKLNAMLVFIHHPEVLVAKTGYVWLKDGAVDAHTFIRDNEADLWSEYMMDLTVYNNAFKQEMFVPRQSGLCNGWCPVKQCEFWKPKRKW